MYFFFSSLFHFGRYPAGSVLSAAGTATEPDCLKFDEVDKIALAGSEPGDSDRSHHHSILTNDRG